MRLPPKQLRILRKRLPLKRLRILQKRKRLSLNRMMQKLKTVKFLKLKHPQKSLKQNQKRIPLKNQPFLNICSLHRLEMVISLEKISQKVCIELSAPMTTV